ncbi:MAG: Coenzyme F420 hydrogenase/dehydrogenase, beta subunit C-terminal domain [Verrucomicrobia bacterium]|nr:Coenzyme F420 hydrogenase/dehydrogenase, beta subunit C-terminal domain [Verrucomicrobiota bacterium]
MDTPLKKLEQEVTSTGLCLGCGACVGVCRSGALWFPDELGDCVPRRRRGSLSDGDEWAYLGCPGRDVDFPTLNQFCFGGQPPNPMLGHWRSLWVGYSGDPAVRRAGASGGVLTTIGLSLLEQKLVDGVIALGPDPERPYRSKPVIARTPDELKACAQSKYTVHPVLRVLAELRRTPDAERYAFVGLPCQIHAVRKLQAAGNPEVRKITWVLGSYCGNILQFGAVHNFLKLYGIDDLSRVVDLQYRAGEWPGKMRVALDDGRVFEMPKFYANYLIPFYILPRCLTCTDLAAEFADISGGDAWAPVYEERGKGYSLIVARSDKGQRLIETLLEQKRLEAEPITEGEAMDAHAHMLDFKKRGAFIRLWRRRRHGKAAPEYRYNLAGPLPLQRAAFESVLRFIFWACSFEAARYLVSQMPVGLTGRLFERARRLWKRATRSTKRKGFHGLEFYVEAPRPTPVASLHDVEKGGMA